MVVNKTMFRWGLNRPHRRGGAGQARSGMARRLPAPGFRNATPEARKKKGRPGKAASWRPRGAPDVQAEEPRFEPRGEDSKGEDRPATPRGRRSSQAHLGRECSRDGAVCGGAQGGGLIPGPAGRRATPRRPEGNPAVTWGERQAPTAG